MIYKYGLIFLISIFTNIQADEPLGPPTSDSVYSKNRQFVAKINFESRITSIFRIDSLKSRTLLWEMYGWFRWADISNDGKYIAIPFSGSNLVPIKYNKEEVMLIIVKEGKVCSTLKFNQIINNFGKLLKTVSHYNWGSFIGFNEKNEYVIETVENNRIYFNYLTNTIRMEKMK